MVNFSSLIYINFKHWLDYRSTRMFLQRLEPHIGFDPHQVGNTVLHKYQNQTL